MRPVLAVVAAALVGAAVYLPTLGHGFVWDDRSLVAENRYLDDWSRWRENLTRDFFRRSGDPQTIGHWRPVVTLSFMVDKSLAGGRPIAFHAVNVLLHAACSGLVAALALRLGLGVAAALGGALLFAVHPVHVESVAWISGRTDLWCGLFVLVALVADLGAARKPSRHLAALGFVATLLALLAKEMGVVAPIAVALRAFLLPGPREAARPPVRRAARAAAWPAAAVVAYLVVRLGVLGIEPVAPSGAAAGRWTLFWTWWVALFEYLRALIAPVHLGIVPRVELVAEPWSARAALAIVAVAGIVAWAARARARAPELTWALLVFLASLAPLTHFVVPVRVAASIPFPWAERFLYVPSMAFGLVAAWGIGRLAEAGAPRSRQRLVALAVAAVLVAGGARTLVRSAEWKDDRTLFGAAARSSPDAAWVWVGLGVALAEGGDPAGGERAYREAIRLDPTNAKAHHNLANILAARGDRDGAESAYRESSRLAPSDPRPRVNLALLLAASGRMAEALPLLEAAERLLPDSAEIKTNRANVLRGLGRLAESVPVYEDALRAAPSLVPALVGLAGARLESGNPLEAERLARRAIGRDPAVVPGWVILAAALDASGRGREAIEAWKEVLRRDPGNAAAARRLRGDAVTDTGP